MRRRRMPLALVAVAFLLAACALDDDPLAERGDASPDCVDEAAPLDPDPDDPGIITRRRARARPGR